MAMRERVCHLAASEGSRVAAGAFEGLVEVWDVSTPARLGSFRTVLDFGGRRLCLDRLGTRCFAGAYRQACVVAYDVADGHVIWSRSDIGRVQKMSRSTDSMLFIGVEDGPCQIVDSADGKTLEKLHGVVQVFESPAGTARLLDRKTPVVELRGGRSFEVQRSSFAILDVAFGPSTLCLSEAAGPTRCLDLDDGREVWRYQPPQGEHVLFLTYCSSVDAFLGVSREYKRTSAYTLVHLGPGENLCHLAALGRPVVAAFCASGEAVLLDDGRLLTASTGELIRNVPLVDGADQVDA